MQAFLNKNGYSISYSFYKRNSIPLVFVHGFCEDQTIWEFTKDYFTENSILLIDLPGFGKSSVIAPTSMEIMSNLLKEILDKEGIKECILFGHSMGGYVCLSFANKYSDYLVGMGLIHSHPYADSEEKKASRLKNEEFLKNNDSTSFLKLLFPALFSEAFSQNNPDLVEQLVNNASTFPKKGIIEGSKAMRLRTDQSLTLKQFKKPVLFIIGDEDTVVPQDKKLDFTYLPNKADIHLLKNVGHMVMFEEKSSYITIMKNFISLCRL